MCSAMALKFFTRQILTITVLILVVNVASGIILDYPYSCPTDCECATLDEFTMDKIQVHCNVLKLTQELNFKVIQTNHTAVLYLVCADIYNSNLFPDMLSHLGELEELGFISCAINKLFPEALRGLDMLRILNLTHSFRNIPLHIQEDSFKYTPNLELLDLSIMGITEFPPGILCTLQSLKHLNLSHNMISSEKQLGYIKNSFDSHSLCLPELTVFDLSANLLTTLNHPLLKYMPNLQELYLNDNNLQLITPNVLENLTQVIYVDLSRNYLASITSLFSGMLNVKTILLAHNQVDCIPNDTLSDTLQLTHLSLQNNSIKTDCLPVFNHLNKLEEIDLSYNYIGHVPNSTFQGLYNLTTLSIAVNNISHIEPVTFHENPYLQFLNLSSNMIGTFIFNRVYINHTMLHLQHLDLSRNGINDTSVTKGGFDSISNMQNLYLSHNHFTFVPIQGTNLTQLYWLDLNYNNITHIDTDRFFHFPNLQYFLLRGNQIIYIPKKAFESLPKLQGIDLSQNKIQQLEYEAFYFLPNLMLLNLRHNKISDISLTFNKVNSLKILYLDYNKIEKIHGIQPGEYFPSSLTSLTLSHNYIKFAGGYFIKYFPQLQVLDLTFNQFREVSNLFLSSPDTIPFVFLAGNYLWCNCHTKWLLNVNRPLSNYAKVADLDNILCETLFPHKGFTFLTTVKPEHFLCIYNYTCPTSVMSDDPCPCCWINTNECPCRQWCPASCSCYKDSDNVDNPIDCANRNIIDIPEKLPESVSHLFLDGNNISVVNVGHFDLANQLIELYLNNSNIKDIIPGSFQGLSLLQGLYLQNNTISLLRSSTFHSLQNLQLLFLQNNDINAIERGAFTGLNSLVTLHLENNELTAIDLDILSELTKTLKHLYMAQNNWLCDCDYGPALQSWLVAHSSILEDNPICGTTEKSVTSNSSHFFVTWVNFDPCKNLTRQVTINRHSKALIPVTSTMAAIFVITLVICFIIYKYIDLLQVWLYSRYGVHMHETKEDENRDYDAFISYSSHNEHFVVRELAPRLEEGDPPYRLCVHYRDWMIGRGIAESIICSVQSSKRTILLLSNNFTSSEWCNYEFRTAHHQMLKDRNCRVIVILMDDKPPENLDDEMKLYIKSHTYIKLSDPWFWQRLKYALPTVPKEQKQARWEAKAREKEMLRQTREAMNMLGIKGPQD